MKSRLVLTLLIACGALSAAEPASKSSTDQLLDTIRYEELAVSSAAAAFDGMAQQMKAKGVPDAAIAEIRAEARLMYQRIFANSEMRKKTGELYSKHFTEDEILEMTAFYRTPLGQKALATMPAIMSDSMNLAMSSVQKEMPAFQQKIAEIVRKHKKPATDQEKDATEAK
jgi:hypothetical protein